MQRSNSVDEYLEQNPKWAPGLKKLRRLMLSTELEETVKWGAPCYTIGGKLVIGLGAFKEHLAIWFHQGALLKDEAKVLVNAQEGKTKALRQWRFNSAKEILIKEIKPYVLEAIENQKQGKAIKPERKQGVVLPAELKSALAGRAKLRKAFEKLTPGKQREYAEHIGSAKREATRQTRLERAIPLIEAGVGLNDKYKNC